MNLTDVIGIRCPVCGNPTDAEQFYKLKARFEEVLADGLDPLHAQMKCQSCGHIGYVREFVKTTEGAMMIWGERPESEYVGKFPIRKDITVLGADPPKGCMRIRNERPE